MTGSNPTFGVVSMQNRKQPGRDTEELEASCERNVSFKHNVQRCSGNLDGEIGNIQMENSDFDGPQLGNG